MMKKLIYILTIFAVMVFTYGCEGPEGDAGPQGYKGSDGATGQTGEEGVDGEDGEDGIMMFDYEKSISTGGVKVVLEGKFPDDTELNESIDFPYNNVWDNFPLEVNSRARSREGGFRFYILRESNMTNYYTRTVSKDEFEMEMIDEYGKVKVDIEDFDVIVLTNDFKSIKLNLDDVSDYVDDVSDYYYDNSTGVLKLKIHALIPGDKNATGKDLSVTIYVDVIVFNDLDGPK